MRKPFFITAYEVTEENMEILAQWCQGVVVREEGKPPFVRVPVERATSSRQTKAFVGTNITVSMRRGEKSFKVYQKEWLDADFDELPEDEIDLAIKNTCCGVRNEVNISPPTPSPTNMPQFRSPAQLV